MGITRPRPDGGVKNHQQPRDLPVRGKVILIPWVTFMSLYHLIGFITEFQKLFAILKVIWCFGIIERSKMEVQDCATVRKY